MDTDERDIFQFLKTWGTEFTNAKEVARRAGNKKRFYEDPDWARPILLRMAERGILEGDVQGIMASSRCPGKRRAASGSRLTSPRS